jgi:hypothetical protein
MVAAALALPGVSRAQQPQALPAGVTATAPGASRVYDAVLLGMSCRQQPSGRMDCEYRVGRSLRFLIAGVGQQDVIINFFKVDADDDYVASVAPLHGCVVVRPASARADTTGSAAFVSSQDGKVYRNWNTCLRTTKK